MKYEEIKALNASYLQETLADENIEEDKIEEELTKCGEYKFRFLKIKELVDVEVKSSNFENDGNASIKTRLKLPKI